MGSEVEENARPRSQGRRHRGPLPPHRRATRRPPPAAPAGDATTPSRRTGGRRDDPLPPHRRATRRPQPPRHHGAGNPSPASAAAPSNRRARSGSRGNGDVDDATTGSTAPSKRAALMRHPASRRGQTPAG
ncbi:hypothetical protein GCM10010166_21180 [Couchioplanes caeruleus subsp. azureus]|nr:hypothetical protein GCM10010166_21180 [Couchioplanes caeruleus subsp. azureus]